MQLEQVLCQNLHLEMIVDTLGNAVPRQAAMELAF